MAMILRGVYNWQRYISMPTAAKTARGSVRMSIKRRWLFSLRFRM